MQEEPEPATEPAPVQLLEAKPKAKPSPKVPRKQFTIGPPPGQPS